MRRKELAKKLGIVVLAFMMAVPCAVPAVCSADAQQPDAQETQKTDAKMPQAAEEPAAADLSQADEKEADKDAQEPEAEKTSGAGTDLGEERNGLTFQMKTYEKEYKTAEGKTYKQVSFEYPLAEGNSQAAQAINKFYKNLLAKWKKMVKENLGEAKSLIQEMEDSDRFYSDQVTCKITSRDDKYISVLQTGYEYTMGAHGLPYRYSYVFDAKTGKKVSAASILGISKSQLNQKVRNLYLEKFDKAEKEGNAMFYQDRSNVKKTLDKTNFNDNRCYVKNGKLRFYTYPYDIAPYAAGFVEVAVKL